MMLPVLMYHNVEESLRPDFLTVTPTQLVLQFQHLQKRGYTPIALSDLHNYMHSSKPLPKKPILLTFDDGYLNNYTNLYPLLQKHNFKAVIFLTSGFVANHTIQHTYLTVADIKKMDKETVEYALHTVDHASYSDLSIADIEKDILNTKAALDKLGITYQPSLAYTYGAFPHKDILKKETIFKLMEKAGLLSAFRIGNRINLLPIKNKFLIQRIDIRGTDKLWKFKLMCKFGRKWLFF